MKSQLLILLFFCSLLLSAQSIDTTLTTSKINEVTVFFSGAQISRQVEFNSINGQQLLLVDDLPLEINKESLRIGDISNAKTISVKLEKGSSRNPKYKEAKEKLKEQKKEIEQNVKYNRTEKGVYDSEELFIIKNRELAGDNGVTIAQISEGANYYRTKLKEIRTKKLELDLDLEKMKEELLELDKQMQKITKDQRKESTQLYVLLDSKIAIPDAKFQISYYLQTAAWEPVYDFRVEKSGDPLVIDYSANIYQSTGEDWNKVNLILSTGDPSLSSNKPILDKWFIDKRKREVQRVEISEDKNATLKGKLLDTETEEPVPFANIVLEYEGVQIGGTSSDFDGNYTIKPVPAGLYNLKATSVGFQPVLIEDVFVKDGKITFLDVYMESSNVVLEEFAVVDYKVPLVDKDQTYTGTTITADDMYNRGYSSGSSSGSNSRSKKKSNSRGSASNETVTYIDGVKVIGSSSMSASGIDYISQGNIINSNYMIDETAKNMSDIEYNIKEPFTVLSDGKDYTLKIKETSVAVEYVYFVVPKLENDAFLTARIANWNELNLLSGKSSIYYKGTFTGESYIDDKMLSDTLDLSLGRDRDILVSRKGNKERLERKVMGRSIKETLSWDIEVRNNKNEKVKILLEDQYPLAENKNIEIVLLEISGAKTDPKTGKLSWELEMDANTKKTIQLTYSIKYPSYTILYME